MVTSYVLRNRNDQERLEYACDECHRTPTETYPEQGVKVPALKHLSNCMRPLCLSVIEHPGMHKIRGCGIYCTPTPFDFLVPIPGFRSAYRPTRAYKQRYELAYKARYMMEEEYTTYSNETFLCSCCHETNKNKDISMHQLLGNKQLEPAVWVSAICKNCYPIYAEHGINCVWPAGQHPHKEQRWDQDFSRLTYLSEPYRGTKGLQVITRTGFVGPEHVARIFQADVVSVIGEKIVINHKYMKRRKYVEEMMKPFTCDDCFKEKPSGEISLYQTRKCQPKHVLKFCTQCAVKINIQAFKDSTPALWSKRYNIHNAGY